MAPWLLYNVYGDTKVLQDNYATMKAYLAYLKTKESGGVVKYGLGDWMAPGGTNVPNVEGAVYVYDMRVVRDVATVLGNTADATLYGSEFTRVQTAYNNAYFDRTNNRYTPVSQANIAMPLEFGIVPAGSEAAVAASLVKDIGAAGGADQPWRVRVGPGQPHHGRRHRNDVRVARARRLQPG